MTTITEQLASVLREIVSADEAATEELERLGVADELDRTLTIKAKEALSAYEAQRGEGVDITPDSKLPCDIRLGESVIKAACSFRTLLLRINAHNEAIAKGWVKEDECSCPKHGEWIEASGFKAHLRELDVAINGELGAAQAPLLIDILGQVQEVVKRLGMPLLPAMDGLCQNADIIEEFLKEPSPTPITPEEAGELAWEVEQENTAQITCFKYGDVHCTNEGLAAIINADRAKR